jgi:type IV pilus assembly protein PilC
MEFKYTAKTGDGQIQKGEVEAKNRTEAINTLHGRSLFILNLEEPQKGGEILSHNIVLFRRVKAKEIVVFSRQLATLFSAKISILESLRALAKQTENKYFSQIIFDMASEVEGGSMFSKVLAKYPAIFSGFFINMVRSGELSGGLQRSLEYLADYIEKTYYMNSKIRGAMMYPAFIMGAFLVVGVLLMILVIPQLTSFLAEAGQTLPVTTRMLIWSSEILRSWGWLVLIFVAGLVTGTVFLIKRSPQARFIFDRMKIEAPIFKNIFRGLYLARITDNLSTLIQGGLPILQALQISADVVGNSVYRKIIMEAKENVRVGNTISSCFQRHREIPPMVVQMVATGEQSGSVDEILKKLSIFYTKEVDAIVGTLSQLIEPVLMVILGIAVAILVASILIPIYNIASGF